VRPAPLEPEPIDEGLRTRAAALKQALRKKRWSRSRLATEIGIDRRTIQRVLDAKPVLETTLTILREAFPELP
jgi:hypothetical protein